MNRKLMACLLLLSCASAVPGLCQRSPLAALDDEISRAVKTFQAPGLAVAVVHDGKVVYSKGFGFRKLGSPEPVDSQTVFGIGSCTKAFTTAAISILAADGKLSWDDRVIDHLPSFQLYDPAVGREIRIRDLVTHRSGLGLGAGDLMIFPTSDFTQDEVIARMRFIPPADGLRYRYAYNNLMYLVAGKVIEKVSGQNWGDFIRGHIFSPAGMTSSSTNIEGIRRGSHSAFPHSKVDGVIKPIEYGGLDNVAPAGAINSNLDDLTRWVRIQLAEGALPDQPGKRLWSEDAARQMHSPQMWIPTGPPPAQAPMLKMNFSAYGLGWRIFDYRGQKIVTHDGGVAGFLTRIVLVPEKQLGIIVMENGMTNVMRPVAFGILDRYLSSAPAFDWIQFFSAADAAAGKRAATAVLKPAPSKPSLPLDRYAGTYTDAWRGDMTIEHSAGQLTIRFSRTDLLTGNLEHFQYDTFIARWRDRSLDADAYVTFSLNPTGEVREIRMEPVSPLTDFSFDFQDLLLRPKPKGKTESGR